MRGIGGNLHFAARQSLQGKIRDLPDLRFRIVERGEQGGNHFLGSQVLQTQDGVHAVRHLAGVQVVEKRLVGAGVMKESKRPQHVAPQRFGAFASVPRERE